MPQAVLASIVFLIGLELVSVRGMLEIYRLSREEFVLATVTAALVVAWGIKQGILLAIVLAMIDHLRRSYNPLISCSSGHPKAIGR
jgi:sulfate permease, SulP family